MQPYYSPYQFTCFRILVGTYLIFENLKTYFNFFTRGESPTTLQLIISGAQLLVSSCIILGIKRRVFAAIGLLLSILWAFPLQYTFADLFFPWWAKTLCLILLVFIPTGEPLSLYSSSISQERPWQFPKRLWCLSWLCLAFGPSVWGFHTAYYSDSNLFYLLGFLVPLSMWNKTRPVVWVVHFFFTLGGALFQNYFPPITEDSVYLFLLFPSYLIRPKVTSHQEGRPIVFFDGVCGLCNGFIDFLFQEDRAGFFNVAALQGETAKKKLPKDLTSDLNSIILLYKGETYQKSQAVLHIFEHLGGLWKILSYFLIIPRSWRDFVYTIVATYRYRWFGKKDTCRMPTKSERDRFLS